MKVKSYKIEDILVIEPQEKFLTGDDIKELEDKFAEAYSAGVYEIIMDFSRTELIYSAFISVLLEYSQKLRQKGGRIKLANPGLEVKKIVEVTHLDQIFEIYSNLEEALDSFRKER
jgi:anti-sigma B factor antagonist